MTSNIELSAVTIAGPFTRVDYIDSPALHTSLGTFKIIQHLFWVAALLAGVLTHTDAVLAFGHPHTWLPEEASVQAKSPRRLSKISKDENKRDIRAFD